MNGSEADFAISGFLSTRSRLSVHAPSSIAYEYTLGKASVRWASGQVGSFSWPPSSTSLYLSGESSFGSKRRCERL